MTKGFVILNYNDFESTSTLLEKIRMEKIEDKICVVDNSSNDDSYEKLSKYKSDNCYIIRNEVNNGYSAGNNLGCRFLIDKFHTDIIIVANPDVAFSKETVEHICSQFEKDSRYAILAPVVKRKENEKNYRPYIYLTSFFEDLMLCFYLYNRYYEKKHIYTIDETKEILDVDAVLGSFFAVRASVLEQINYLDEGTFLFYEEMILSMRISNLNNRLRIGLLTNEEYVHNHSVSIRKNVSVMKTYRIYMDSKKYYEKEYHHIGIIKQILLFIATVISCFEKRVYLFIQTKGKY